MVHTIHTIQQTIQQDSIQSSQQDAESTKSEYIIMSDTVILAAGYFHVQKGHQMVVNTISNATDFCYMTVHQIMSETKQACLRLQAQEAWM